MQYYQSTSHIGFQYANGSGFSPDQVTAVSAWLRLAASTAVAGEYATVVDVLNSNPTSQTDAARKPAAATAANGLPVMTYDATDMLVWPVAASNNSTTKWGIAFWFKPSASASTQHFFSGYDDAGGASAKRIQFFEQATSAIAASIYISGSNGRKGLTSNNVLTNGTWAFVTLLYNSSGATEDDKLKIFVNCVNLGPLTFSNVGIGGTLGDMVSITGNYIIGARNDSGAPTQPLANNSQIGPNIYVFDAIPSTAELTALMNFEIPT